MAKQGALLRGMKVVGMTITGASIQREVRVTLGFADPSIYFRDSN